MAKKQPEKKLKHRKTGNPKGRPAWIPTPDILKEIERYASLGLNIEQIANCIGIAGGTLHEKKATDFPEINEALKRGRDKGIALRAKTIIDAADGGNLTAAIFFLKCHGGWVEKQQIAMQHSGSVEIVRKIIGDVDGDL